MRVTRLELRDFRSYRHWELEPGPDLTVLVGRNAAGKTNVIEALQLLTAATSFRRPEVGDLVRWGAERGRAALTAEGEGRLLEVVLDVGPEGRRYTVNGNQRRRAADVAGLLPSVTFTPEHLEMVKGPAERRRADLDALGEQLSRTYGAVRRDYQRAVRQRNVLLKEDAPRAQVEALDEVCARFGGTLLAHRVRLLRRVMAHAAPAYEELAGETLAAEYRDKAGAGEGPLADPKPDELASAILGELRRRAPEERARRVTLAGPHRDDVVFLVEGRDARAFASQGEQRTVALAWKLAEVKVVEEVLKAEPVLLLDDVMSELDETRRAALTGLVERRVQTFITTTNPGYFEPGLLDRAKVVEVRRGA